MIWRNLTDDDVLSWISARELQDYREAYLGDGQTDPVERQIQHVCSFVRGFIFRCRKNREGVAKKGGVEALGDAYVIPESLMKVALDILCPIIEKRVNPSPDDPNGIRRLASKDSLAFLETVAACEYQVDEDIPVEDEDERLSGPKASPRITPRKPRQLDW